MIYTWRHVLPGQLQSIDGVNHGGRVEVRILVGLILVIALEGDCFRQALWEIGAGPVLESQILSPCFRVNGCIILPNNYFAPANDPFVYAQVPKEIVDAENMKKKITNLYLCPLATKPIVLGLTLFYLMEWVNKEAIIIFSFCPT